MKFLILFLLLGGMPLLKDNKENLITLIEKNANILKEIDDQYEVKKIENKKNIVNLINDNKLIYLDFDENNGYMILDEDNTIYDYTVRGNLDIINNYKNTLYFDESGFLYKIDGIYYSFMENYDDLPAGVAYEDTYEDSGDDDSTVSSNRTYTVDGVIKDSVDNPNTDIALTDYLNENFGEYSRSIYASDNLDSDFYLIHQGANAVYYHTTNSSKGEGNCGINSAYLNLLYWNGKETSEGGNMNFASDGIVSFNPNLTESLVSKTYCFARGFAFISDIVQLPYLYYTIRDYAKSNGYNAVDGMTIQQLRSSINSTLDYLFVGSEFNYSTQIYNSFSLATIKNEISNDRPIILQIQETENLEYGSHFVNIIGYRTYDFYTTRTIGSGSNRLISRFHKFYTFFKICDNWTSTPNDFRWYDVASLSSPSLESFIRYDWLKIMTINIF